MSIFFWHSRWRECRLLLVAALAGTSTLAAHAQAAGNVRLDPTPTLEASQPHTPVPAAAYHSVFAGLPLGVETTVRDWKAANTAVGQFPRGHSDLLKWEQTRPASRGTPGAQP